VHHPDMMRGLAGERSAPRTTKAESPTGVAEALANVALFSLCSKKELKLISKLAEIRSVGADTVLMREGEAGDEMLILLRGTAVVTRKGRKLADLGTGAAVGELALLSRGTRTATVTTRGDAAIAVISRSALQRLLQDAPGFSRKLLEAIANRVRELDRQVVA